MRSTKSIMLIVIALGCGLIASIGISQVMDSQDSDDSGVQTELIYVAATNVASWSKLNSAFVKQEPWPIDKIPPGAARSLEEFEGMSPKYPLYPGEPIVIAKLSDSNGKVASERIPEGLQVFSVKVDRESALSGLVKPGDRVDILVFIRGRNGSRIKTGTRTILRNVTVFAVNDQLQRSDEESTIDAKTVSLLVEPGQSERLLLAKQLGTIHLALRKPGDESDVQTDGARPGDLDDSERNAGPTGQVATDSKPTGGLFNLITKMKGEDSKAVDTSSAAMSRQMVIMSPTGIIQQFSFPDAGNGIGPAPLPPEIGSPAAPVQGPAATFTQEPTTAPVATPPKDDLADTVVAEESPELDSEGFLDPALLGL